jgi:hypothetical protein
MRRTVRAMPKAFAIFISVIGLAVALSDCGGSSSSTPAPSPSVSFTPNPTVTKATVSVTLLGSPAPNIPVQESTPANPASPRPGTPFITTKTGKEGMARFYKLDPNKTYCWVAILGSSPSKISSTCANWTVWQFDTITLGT